jgi:hypothetical protein
VTDDLVPARVRPPRWLVSLAAVLVVLAGIVAYAVLVRTELPYGSACTADSACEGERGTCLLDDHGRGRCSVWCDRDDDCPSGARCHLRDLALDTGTATVGSVKACR